MNTPSRRVEITLQDGRLVLLRHARFEDARGLLDSTNEVAAERRYITMERVEATEEQEREWMMRKDISGDLLLVAEWEGRIIGSLTTHRAPGQFRSHVTEFGITLVHAFRGYGLGRHMIEYAIDWCRCQGFEKLNLEVFHDNHRAIALYRRLGFEVEGVRGRQVKIDDRYIDLIQMTLFL